MSEVPSIANLEQANREISQLREELRKAVAEVARAREENRHKMGKFAREFRVPLTTVLGFSDILSATDKSHRAELNQIAIAGHELMELIKDLEEPLPAPPASDHHAKDGEALTPVVHAVLHIEDNETNFRLTERILEDRPNIESLWGSTGEQGLELACKHSPTLILLDLNLPDIHGSEVLARLRNNPLTAQIPVIVLSADASPSRIERMLQAGARNYLTKPFDIKRLLCVVDETLESAAQTVGLPATP
jgi:CheY-like chemotaxis protein